MILSIMPVQYPNLRRSQRARSSVIKYAPQRILRESSRVRTNTPVLSPSSFTNKSYY
jgi:hypothetical protein